MSQVRNLADDVKAAHPDGIDMLANNAGIFPDHLKVQKLDSRTVHFDAGCPYSLCGPLSVPNMEDEDTSTDLIEISHCLPLSLKSQRSIILQKTDDGYESTWAVNVMAPFLLTSLLLDHIKDSIVNVSSISAGSSMDFNNLQQVSKLLSLAAPASRL